MKSLRVCESQLARTAAALNPTKLRLGKAETEIAQLASQNAMLREQNDHEVARLPFTRVVSCRTPPSPPLSSAIPYRLRARARGVERR